jgi:hypothetical protein
LRSSPLKWAVRAGCVQIGAGLVPLSLYLEVISSEEQPTFRYNAQEIQAWIAFYLPALAEGAFGPGTAHKVTFNGPLYT